MILGHERQIDYLNKVLKNGRLAHAYLFYGPEHIGKFTIAKLLAKTLHCEKSVVSLDGVCGLCTSCRLIDSDHNPNVIVLDREHSLLSKKDKRKDIPIEDIRELRRILSLTPEGNKWRVVIVNEAERTSPEAADSFLKLLEEPGQRILFILVSHERELLSPTIISRSQSIRFSTVADAMLGKFLASRPNAVEKSDKVVLLAAGRPGVLLRLLEEKDTLLEDNKLVETLNKIINGSEAITALELSQKIAYNDEVRKKAFEYTILLIRSRMQKAVGTGETALALRALRKIINIHEVVETTNVNPRLALDSALLTFTTIKGIIPSL